MARAIIFRPPSFAIMARAIFSGRHPSRLWPGPYFPAAIFRDYGPGHIFRPPSFAIMARAIIFRPPSFAIMARAIFSGRHPSRLWPGPYFPAAIFLDYGPGHIFRPPSFAIMARAIFSGRHLSRLWPGPYFPAAILRDYGPGPARATTKRRFSLRPRGPGHESFRSFRSFRSNGATTMKWRSCQARTFPAGVASLETTALCAKADEDHSDELPHSTIRAHALLCAGAVVEIRWWSRIRRHEVRTS